MLAPKELRSEAIAALERIDGVEALEQFRVRYLGPKGKLRQGLRGLGSLPPGERASIGASLNALRDDLTVAHAAAAERISGGRESRTPVDVTEPSRPSEPAGPHVLHRVIDELTDLFGRMGFEIASGPELEDEFHNFQALNIPAGHPARDPLDNFYLDATSDDLGDLLLRTQTSTVQIRVLEGRRPPIRVVIPGRVYRPDTHDDTHLSMFHQLEALVIDRGVTMVDLKSTVLQFVHAFFGPQTRVRFRASFFPFTEPSAEVDVWFEDRQAWVELGGCGMVHPNVLKNVGLDAEEYGGWAFGFGIERIAMRRYGIGNIRLFVENDLRVLRQF